MPSRRRIWWRRTVRSAAIVSLLVLAILTVLVGAIVRYGSQDRAHPADVIVVLGGGTTGTPRRALHAATLYEQGYAPYVVCTGGVAASRLSEAERCAGVLLAYGIDPEAVVLEQSSRSTEENAIAVRAIMAQHGWRSALLVSDDFHLWRARWMFAEQGVTVFASPAQITTGSLGWRETAHALLREIAAVGWYVGKTVLGLPYTDTPLTVDWGSSRRWISMPEAVLRYIEIYPYLAVH